MIKFVNGPYSGVIEHSNKIYRFLVQNIADNEYEVWLKHHRFIVELKDEQSEFLTSIHGHAPQNKEIIIKSPMPGLVVAVEVAPGDEIETGAGLLILEAMKMENEIKSPAKAKVKKIEVKKGDKVEKGQSLLILEL